MATSTPTTSTYPRCFLPYFAADEQGEYIWVPIKLSINNSSFGSASPPLAFPTNAQTLEYDQNNNDCQIPATNPEVGSPAADQSSPTLLAGIWDQPLQMPALYEDDNDTTTMFQQWFDPSQALQLDALLNEAAQFDSAGQTSPFPGSLPTEATPLPSFESPPTCSTSQAWSPSSCGATSSSFGSPSTPTLDTPCSSPPDITPQAPCSSASSPASTPRQAGNHPKTHKASSSSLSPRFRCSVCNKAHKDQRALDRHLWSRHPDLAARRGAKSETTTCRLCHYSSRADNVRRHEKTQHGLVVGGARR